MSYQRSREATPIVMIGGAFVSAESCLWPPRPKARRSGEIIVLKTDHSLSIESRVQAVLQSLQTLNQPVQLYGHSLGALVAYQAAQCAPEGLVLGTALICPAMIGGAFWETDLVELFKSVLCPFNSWQQLHRLRPERWESISALMDAYNGTVPVGLVPKNVLVVAARDDLITRRSAVFEVAKRIDCPIMEVPGGHDFPSFDHSGSVLKSIRVNLSQLE